MKIRPSEFELLISIARSLRSKLPRSVEMGDLISDGYFGLHRAKKKFDRSRGVPFGAFARKYIRGAMIDGLRQRDHISRTMRARGVFPSLVPLNEQLAGENSFDDDMVISREWITSKLPWMGGSDRFILRLYYLEGFSMKQIADCMGVSESRVSQMHRNILRRLRSAVGETRKAA